MEQLIIETERLLIRNLKLSDLPGFYVYRSDPEVAKYQGFNVMTIQQAEEFIRLQKDKLFGKAGEWVQYAIENKSISKIIGDCAIRLEEDDTRIGQIGITLSPQYQKKGFAKEALTGIVNFLFKIPDFHRIVEITDAENIASVKLLERVGFRREGHFIENIFFKGKWGSEFQYAMLKNEWAAKN